MNKSLILLFIFASFCACKPNSTEKVENNITADTLEEFDIIDETYSEFETVYIVSAAQGYHYDSLKEVAQSVSMFLHWKIDSTDRYYNPVRKSILVKEDSDDEMWRGEYYLRRFGDNFVSVEMQYAYMDLALKNNPKEEEKFYQDTTKMFVCAGIFENLNKAETIAQKLKEICPSVTIITKEMYMGCMH